MDREKYLADTGGIVRIQTTELLDEIERLENRDEEINDYDPGIINDYGGGMIDWWMSYIKTEIDKCNEHWREALKEGE